MYLEDWVSTLPVERQRKLDERTAELWAEYEAEQDADDRRMPTHGAGSLIPVASSAPQENIRPSAALATGMLASGEAHALPMEEPATPYPQKGGRAWPSM